MVGSVEYTMLIVDRWNKLPEHIKNAPSTNSFKNQVDNLNWFKDILYTYDN